MQLRYYQQEAKEAVKKQWQTVDKTLIVQATGCGKTILFCKLAEDEVAIGKRVLILAHRGELLDQAADKMMQSTGLGCSVEKAEQSCLNSWFRITVGSVQTLMTEKRLARFDRDHFDIIIVDEAHHALASSYQNILEYFDRAKVLGVTATPDRGDMKNLGQYFESLAHEYNMPQAIKDGFLVPIKAQTIPLKIDLTGVKSQSGDYQAKALGNALDPYLEVIADEMKRYCEGRKVVIFLPLIATSQKMQAILIKKGFSCGEVNGESKDRAETLSRFDNGEYDVLCNSMLLTEGWDCPSVDCIICLRPTKIRSLYVQIIGRGTRLSPETGKEFLLILDFLWNTKSHELCRPATLVAGSEEVAEKMTEILEETGDAMELDGLEEQAESDCVEEREEALAEKLAQCKARKRSLVDPLQFEMSIQAQDLSSYTPSFGWEMGPASDAQKARLERSGVFPDEVGNAGKAAKIIDRLDKRKTLGLTTPKQIRFLESRGFKHVGQWDFSQARNLTDRIAGNKWRIPHDINPSQYTPPPVRQPQSTKITGWK